MIKAAAIMGEDGLIYHLPPPARHHHIIKHMADLNIGREEQGFIDHNGKFFGRISALCIARDCGQLKRDETDPKKYQGNELFSEDLW